MSENKFKTLILTTIALVAFAANSIFCRMALGEASIDAASFTAIRLISGAITLMILLSLKKGEKSEGRGSWLAAFMLFLYAACFSFAYITLETGTGALILFGAVQITIILLSILSGNRLHFLEWVGVLISGFGFVYLVLPGLGTPSLFGFILMTMAGVAWGVYTLKGKGSLNPLSDTGSNFLRCVPFAAILLFIFYSLVDISPKGATLAVLSGALASGLGYAIWYRALRDLSATLAAIVQLSVPVIAALGGVLFMSEILEVRLIFSAIFILGGILLVVLKKYLTKGFSPPGPRRLKNS